MCEPYKVPAPIDILGNLAPIAVNATFCPTNNNAFPMGSKYTELSESDYGFMERFIDVTKSNLFFSE